MIRDTDLQSNLRNLIWDMKIYSGDRKTNGKKRYFNTESASLIKLHSYIQSYNCIKTNKMVAQKLDRTVSGKESLTMIYDS